MLLGLDHVQLAMPKGCESQARAFYGILLGLVEEPKPEALQARGGVWFVLLDGRQLHMGIEEPFNPAKKAHPCFMTQDVVALADTLIQAGYTVQWDELIPEVKRFYSLDPFGNRLEFR